jgi:uncharacterized membrane protein
MTEEFLTQYTLTFVIYAFIGYVCEVVYCSVGQRRLVNRGFLYGPWLPIYGCGGLIVNICLIPLKSYPVLVFILGMILTSIVEYIGSWGLEKIFSIKLWDYSKHFCNINGRVCLLNSSLFGVMSISLVYLVQPWIDTLINLIPYVIQYYLADVLRILFAIDLTMSIIKMSAFKKALRDAVDKAREIQEKAKEYASQGRLDFQKEYAERMEKELNEQKMRFSLTYNRILKAFPNATAKRSEMKEQIAHMQKWAVERKEAVREYRENMKKLRKEYKEKVREINGERGRND